MDTDVLAEIDAFDGSRDPRQQRLDQFALLGREREDRTVVVSVRVCVEKHRVLGEGRADRRDDLGSPPF